MSGINLCEWRIKCVNSANYAQSYLLRLHLITVILLLPADFPLERKTPVVYEDGVYEIVAESRRGNVLVISNLTQHGLSGLGSARRTAFFIFFGMPQVEKIDYEQLLELTSDEILIIGSVIIAF